jgi:hypothetical protein
MRRLRKRITALEKEMAELKSALRNLKVTAAGVPIVQVSTPGGVIPVQTGPTAGRLDLNPNGASLVLS